MNNLLGKHTKNLTDKKFGSLLAIKPQFKDKITNALYWLFKCDCGKEHIARGNIVTYVAKHSTTKGSPSCGCVELANKTKHGLRTIKNTHPIYRAYQSMINRCYNPNHSEYKWYGAKGISVCNEWKSNMLAFYTWSIANNWKKGLHIEKDILSKKLGIHPPIYSPKTCQWTTAKRNVGFSTNRKNYGKHPNIKLSEQQANEIIHLYSNNIETNMSKLARDFGIRSPSSIRKLLIKAKVKKG